MKIFYLFGLIFFISSCSSITNKLTLYDELGGLNTINKIVENFINEIGNDDKIRPFFEETEIDRFHEKLTEQICQITDGPCQYSGDTMVDSHMNMGVTEDAFNHTVDLLINAMTTANVSHRLQNKILKRLAPLRKDIIYIEQNR